MTPGVYEIDRLLYHADGLSDRPTLSASVAKVLLAQSPLHARECHPKLRRFEPEPAEPKFDVGTACHALFLEGNANVCIVPYDNWRTAAAKEIAAQARADGLTPLLAKQWDEVRAMEEAVWKQLDAHSARPRLFRDGKPEQTLIWEEQGVMCRARLDWLHDDFSACDDLKSTTRSAHPEQWTRTTMFSIGADIQAAFYARGVKALTGLEPVFRFVIAETTPPYAISVVAPGPDVLALAEKKVDRALAIWRRCLADDNWPGYEARVAYAELPSWEEARFLEWETRGVAA
jgi:hypothetical protein